MNICILCFRHIVCMTVCDKSWWKTLPQNYRKVVKVCLVIVHLRLRQHTKCHHVKQTCSISSVSSVNKHFLHVFTFISSIFMCVNFFLVSTPLLRWNLCKLDTLIYLSWIHRYSDYIDYLYKDISN